MLFSKVYRSEFGRKRWFLRNMFFCDKSSAYGKSLCRAPTLKVDFKVRECTLKLQDQKLLARLSTGYLIAQDDMHHL